MPLPPKDKKFHEKNRIDHAIDEFAAVETPTAFDMKKVSVAAQVQAGIDAYRAAGKNMSLDELEDEVHSSSVLGQFMTSCGDPRPHPMCDAHAIISGAHSGAAETRAVLAWFARRIDDPINGCWLPRNTAAKGQMPKRLRNAVAHSRIHRKNYYEWLVTQISMTLIKTDAMLEQALRMVELHLQQGTFPKRVMLPAGQSS